MLNMFAPPPQLNYLVLKSSSLSRSEDFFFTMGMCFGKDHSSNSESYFYCCNHITIELQSLAPGDSSTSGLTFGLLIDAIDEYLPELVEKGATIITAPHDTDIGRKATISDPDGHIINLLCQNGT